MDFVQIFSIVLLVFSIKHIIIVLTVKINAIQKPPQIGAAQTDEKEFYYWKTAIHIPSALILNTNKIKEKICAEIQYKPVKNSYEIVGLIFSKF